MRTINPFIRPRKSFRTRIFLFLTLLILIISTAFTIIYVHHETADHKEQLITQGDILARLLAYNSRLAVFAEHADMLREAADGILQNDQVLSATIFSVDGKMLVDRSRRAGEGSARETAELPAVAGILARIRENSRKTFHVEKADCVECFAPVIAGPGYTSPESLYFSDAQAEQKDQTIGVVRVVLDKRELNARLHTLLLTGLLMATLFLVPALFIAYIVTRGVTRPLSRLMAGARTLEQGDLSGRIPVETEDELGMVSHAFNSMAETLERREAEKRELEEKLLQAQQMKAKEEWERTFDTVPDLIAILDEEHRIVRVNKTMADRLGVNKEAAIGTRLYPLLHDGDCPREFAHLSTLLANGATYFGEIYEEKLQSFFLVTVSPLLNSDGNVTGSVYVARDITGRKQAEDLLQKAEERFRLIAETIVEVIWMTDVDVTQILYISPAYAQVWGRSLESLHENPRSFIDAVHPEDRKLMLNVLEKQKTGEPYELEYRIVRPDGSIRWIWDRGYPVREETGEVTCYTGVAQDITVHKLAEEEKRAIQAKLVQTNKMTSLGLLVSGLAHEVNNPNNNIKLTAHLLTKSWKDILPVLEKQYREEGDFTIGGLPFPRMREALPQHIASVRENSRRIEGIIRNLRDFARKGAANMDFAADANMIVSVAASLLNSQIKQHTRHFKLDLGEDMPAVRGNPQQLEQVVINLIMNAIQALPDKDRKVVVSTSADREGGFAVITVDDEGTGMPAEVRERVCEPFFSTKLDHGGTGLGLAISNFIIKEHKGMLEFESEPGKGTTVRVKLPLAQNA
ncbi:MAG TPA: PAS domain S-box protein [Geobacteraceae bacterium]